MSADNKEVNLGVVPVLEGIIERVKATGRLQGVDCSMFGLEPRCQSAYVPSSVIRVTARNGAEVSVVIPADRPAYRVVGDIGSVRAVCSYRPSDTTRFSESALRPHVNSDLPLSHFGAVLMDDAKGGFLTPVAIVNSDRTRSPNYMVAPISEPTEDNPAFNAAKDALMAEMQEVLLHGELSLDGVGISRLSAEVATTTKYRGRDGNPEP